MSRLYDTVEPSVIDEEMLMRAVEEQGPKEEAGKIAKMEGIDFADVASLRLDFKSKMHNILFFPELYQDICTQKSAVRALLILFWYLVNLLNRRVSSSYVSKQPKLGLEE